MSLRMFHKRPAEPKKKKKRGLNERELFNLTIKEMKKALPHYKQMIISVPENFREEGFDRLDRIPEGKLAHVFVSEDKQIAHVVYYPGVSTDNAQIQDIPLSQIVKAVDKEIQMFPPDLIIKKHISVAVYKKHALREDHFVALTEVNGKLTVVNPKGWNPLDKIADTNPDPEYLKTFIGNFNEKPLPANIQASTDKTSCGYIVAAIHTKTASMDVTKGNFHNAMEEITPTIKSLIADYQAENKNQVPVIPGEYNEDIGTFSMDEDEEENLANKKNEETAKEILANKKNEETAKEILASLQKDIVTAKWRQRSGEWREVHLTNEKGDVKKIAVPQPASLMLIEIQKATKDQQTSTQAVRNIIKISIKPEIKTPNFYRTMLKKMQIDPVASLDKIEQAIIGENVKWHLRGGGEVIDVTQEERKFSKKVPEHARKMLEEIAKVYEDITNNRNEEEKYYTALSNIILIASKAAANDHFLRHKKTQLFYETITNHLVIKDSFQPANKLKR